jgi:glutathione S-transferase
VQKEEAAIASVQKALKVLDGYLLEHTFLVGESVTLADIIAACNLYNGFTKVNRGIVCFGVIQLASHKQLLKAFSCSHFTLLRCELLLACGLVIYSCCSLL